LRCDAIVLNVLSGRESKARLLATHWHRRESRSEGPLLRVPLDCLKDLIILPLVELSCSPSIVIFRPTESLNEPKHGRNFFLLMNRAALIFLNDGVVALLLPLEDAVLTDGAHSA
jgi:hypothetical protein